MIQTRQHLRCHRRVEAGVELVTTGRIAQRYEKRGRTYVDVETTVVTADAPDDPVWTSEVSFTPAATLGIHAVTESRTRSLAITEELVRAYSRRGNFHSDPTLSADLALPGLVAQGVQAAGPAYGVLLDAWGEEFLAHGEIEMRFVGIVLAGETVDARVDIDARRPRRSTVVNTTASRTAVVGRRDAQVSRPERRGVHSSSTSSRARSPSRARYSRRFEWLDS